MKSEIGGFELDTPSDRNATFEPQLVPKRATWLGEGTEEQIIALYARREKPLPRPIWPHYSATRARGYPTALRSWITNLDRLSAYFAYPERIRRVIYTTNTVEVFNRQLRQTTKTKGAFPSESALLKLLYLAVQQVSQRLEAGLSAT